MQTNQFGTILYHTQVEMLAGIAGEFWTAQGNNSPEQIDALGCSEDGISEARECVEGWGLDIAHDDDEAAHMDLNSYTLADLAAAMRDFWATRPDRA